MHKLLANYWLVDNFRIIWSCETHVAVGDVVYADCSNSFFAGDLGPSTIVGSAAFNLLVIIAVCCTCMPDGEGRRIADVKVFFVTATSSVFA